MTCVMEHIREDRATRATHLIARLRRRQLEYARQGRIQDSARCAARIKWIARLSEPVLSAF